MTALDFLEGGDPRSAYQLLAEAETRYGMILLNKQETVPLPLASFPPRLQAMMSGYHDVYGSAYEHFGLSLLTTAASAIGNSLQVKHKSNHPPLFYGVLIAPPGSGKTPIISTCIAPLLELAREKVTEFRHKLTEYREELKRSQQEADELVEPQPERPVVTSVTIERLYKLMLSTPNGILVYRDELRGWLNSMNQYKTSGDDYEFWLSAHDALRYSVDRKNEKMPLFIDRLMLNIIGGVQPGVLKAIATKDNQDSGMLSRMTFAWPDTLEIRDYNEDEVSDDYAARWRLIVRFLYNIRPARFLVEGQAEREVPETVHLSTAAKQHLEVYWNALQDRLRTTEDEAELATISKFRSRSLRLALVLHALEWADRMVETGYHPDSVPADDFRADMNYDNDMNAIYGEISEGTMARALDLAVHYEDSNMRVVRQAADPSESLPEKERAWYQSLPEQGTRALAQELGKKAGMKPRTIDRRLKRADLFKYNTGKYERRY